MNPYYQDEAVTLYNARCEDVLPRLELSGPVHLLTDPPYFGVKPDEWDNQWGKADEFLAWMGEWLDLAKPHLGGDASVWVFASPEMTSAVERVVAEWFRVLNTVRWLKQGSMSHRASLPALRQFLPTWEGIVFAERVEQVANAYVTASEGVWRDVFTPVRESLVAWRDQHGLTNRQVDDCLGTAGMAGHYFSASQWALPTEEAWGKMFALVGGEYEQHRAEYEQHRAEYEQHRAEYEHLRAEYEHLRAEYEHLRRPFNVTNRKLASDVWALPSVPPDPNRHPCEKPEALIAHMIETTTRPGDTILDCFAGSGAILDTARQLGRKAVGIEMDRHWCDHAVRRLAQMTLPMGPA